MVKRIKNWDKLNGHPFVVNGNPFTLETISEDEEEDYTTYRFKVRTQKLVEDLLYVNLTLTSPNGRNTLYTLEMKEPGSVTKTEINIPEDIMRDYIEFKRELFSQITTMMIKLKENQQWIRNSGLI